MHVHILYTNCQFYDIDDLSDPVASTVGAKWGGPEIDTRQDQFGKRTLINCLGLSVQCSAYD